MAKKEIEKTDTEETVEVEEVVQESGPVNKDRQARWEKFLADAERQNPVKFAIKKKAGEFEVIPDAFR